MFKFCTDGPQTTWRHRYVSCSESTFPKPLWECVRESVCVTTQAFIQPAVRGGCIPLRAQVSSSHNVHVCVVSEIVPPCSLKGITTEVKSQSLKGQKPWFWLVCMCLSAPPPLHSSVNPPAQRITFRVVASDVWSDTLHCFINAVLHFLKSLSSHMSNLQDNILRNLSPSVRECLLLWG